jgi:septal ring factor EnvC (AmiA/AmiB activator)
MPALRRSTRLGRSWILVSAAAALFCALAPGAPAPTKRIQTEAELKAVKAEIARVRDKVNHDQVETDRVARELRAAEVSAADARDALEHVRTERADRVQRRAQLATDKHGREARIAAERAALAAQLRAAYLIGRDEPLKLLFNQQDPSRAGRMFAYYGYFGRARAGEVERITASVHELDTLDGQLSEQEQHLTDLESERRSDVDRLEQARTHRSEALVTLKAQSRNRAQTLERLQREQSGLETLLRELRRALEKFPVDSSSPFAQLRGKLAWPVSGQMVARYGETRAGGVKWDGVLFAVERGAQVRAIYQGRVIFADWLPGLGLLTIIDHGDGYLSLYGHNERLFKAVGESVSAGEAIAAAGDSGGSARPELYFEIRRGGRPVDPRPWFKSAGGG